MKKNIGKSPQKLPSHDKVVISSEYYQNDKPPSYLCSFCNQTLIRLSDASGNNNMWWCRHCSIEFDPASENLRKESKLSVPDRNIEPAATSIGYNMADEVSIRHMPPFRGALLNLQRRVPFISQVITQQKGYD